MNIGYLPVCDSLPLFVALENNYFSKLNLDVTLQEHVTGYSVISSILSGSANAGLVGSVPYYFAKLKNKPLSIIADGGHISKSSDGYFALVVRSGVNKIEDLRHKKVAINGFNTNSDVFLQLALNKNKLFSSLEVITMPMWAMNAAIHSKKIDAAILYEPYVSMLLHDSNHCKILVDSNQTMVKFQNCYICMGNDESDLSQFKSAYNEAISFIKRDEKAAKEILKNKLKIDEKILNRIVLPKWDPLLDGHNAIDVLSAIIQQNDIKVRGQIEFNNVTVTFENQDKTFSAIKEMTFKVDPGEFVCILGTSGCGKSTILNLVAGFIPPTDGVISQDGCIIDKPSMNRGIVFQSHTLFPWKTVRRNIEFGLKMKGVQKDDRKKISDRFIQLVGLRGFENSYPFQLSGGMEQRVGIARVLANDPLVILMDEPFGALDAQTRQEMQELLLQIWSEFNNTIIFVTHDIDEAIYLSDRILVLTSRPGRIKDEIRVDLPRPRNLDVFTSDKFISIKKNALSLIRDERNLSTQI